MASRRCRPFGVQKPPLGATTAMINCGEHSRDCTAHATRLSSIHRPGTHGFGFFTCSPFTRALSPLLTRLKKRFHHIDNSVAGVKHQKIVPLVECQTRMRNVETNHVTNANVVAVGNVQIGVLVHHFD